MHTYDNIKKFDISIKKVEGNQKQFKSNLNEITRGSPKNKSKNQLNTIENIKNIYESRKKVIELYNDYVKIMSEAKYKTKYGEGIIILTAKQMLQRLPIALAQVKAGNNSENLLNEIRQIIYYLYQSKEITKKVYNNIIKSIQI